MIFPRGCSCRHSYVQLRHLIETRSPAKNILDDFDARSPDELNLRKTDHIELVELDNGFGDGWYLGRHLRLGVTGLFPGGKVSYHIASFTQVLTSVPVYTAKLPSQFTPFLAPRTGAIKSHDPPKIEMSGPSPTTVEHPPPVYSQTANPAVTPRSSIPPSPTSYFPGISRSIGQALAGSSTGEDSPVMNETLSVIDEHITDLSTPRQSLAPSYPLRGLGERL